MDEKTIMYSLTFFGLYLELAGAFLLSAEAIGITNLQKISEMLRKRRIISFIILVVIIVAITLLSKIYHILHLLEALILVFSLGIIYDFAPRFIDIIVKRQKKGTLGMVGFVLFSLGFSVRHMLICHYCTKYIKHKISIYNAIAANKIRRGFN